MASSVVDICNLALRRVKAERIEALDENSNEAEECDALYENRRDTLLTSYNWRFAKTTAALTVKASESSDEWLYVYDYPNNCFRIHYIIPPESGKNVVSGTGIATPRIDYELAWFMAIDLAPAHGGDSANKYGDRAEKMFERSIAQATAKTANEAEDGRQRLPRAIQARHGSVDRDYFYGDLSIRRY